MGVAENLRTVKDNIPSHVTLVAVSKTKPDELIMEAYQAGHRDFGENKVQDLAGKQERLPADIRWHMIGHLQSNKVKYLAPFVHLLHGVDSLKLLGVINRYAEKDMSMALDLDPLNGEIWFEKGKMDEQLGNMDSACYCYRKAMQYGVFEALELINKRCK